MKEMFKEDNEVAGLLCIQVEETKLCMVYSKLPTVISCRHKVFITNDDFLLSMMPIHATACRMVGSTCRELLSIAFAYHTAAGDKQIDNRSRPDTEASCEL